MNILKNIIRLFLGITGFIADLFTLCSLSANFFGDSTPWWERVPPRPLDHLIKIDEFTAVSLIIGYGLVGAGVFWWSLVRPAYVGDLAKIPMWMALQFAFFTFPLLWLYWQNFHLILAGAGVLDGANGFVILLLVCLLVSGVISYYLYSAFSTLRMPERA